MAPKLQPWKALAFAYGLALLWGVVVVLQVACNIVYQGFLLFMRRQKREVRPAVMEDSSLGQHSFIQLSEVQLHYVVCGEEGRPLVVMLHGFPECWFSWRFQMRALSKDYRVVAVDMRGYGESEKPAGVANYTKEKLSGDIKELVHKLGYEHCVLAMHDWGGVVGFDLVLRHPDLVSKLIVCNIPHPRGLKMDARQLLRSWYIFFFQLPWLPELVIQAFDYKILEGALTENKVDGMTRGAVTEEELEAFKYSISRPGSATAMINYYRALVRYELPAYEQGWKVKPPTLLVWGTQDAYLGVQSAENSLPYMPDCRVKWVAAGHWVNQQEPDLTNGYILDFLKE